MFLVDKFQSKYIYWKGIIERQHACNRLCQGHQVRLYNWSYPVPQDLWLVDFIEQRGLLKDKPHARIALYSIFAPFWLSRFDGADARLFVERENLHKPSMQSWLHRFLKDDRIDLSLGFDEIKNEAYMRFPFWLMWSVFPPTATPEEVRQIVQRMNAPSNHSYADRHFCAYVCSHDDIGRREIFDSLSSVGRVHADGRLFHNNDDLKGKYGDDKLEYLRHYRFNLTPENTNYRGYVTEKLFEAIYAGCVPIYHGSDNEPEPEILNRDAIIFIEMGKDNSEACMRIAELNEDEKRYMEFANQPRLLAHADEIIVNYLEQLESKLRTIIANI